MFSFGKKSSEILKEVDIKVQDLARLALEETEVDFSIISGVRTKEEQYALFSSGLSELDGIIKKSSHQFGKAIDVLPYVKGLDCWDYNNPDVKLAWYEVHRAFLRAGRLLGLELELGLTYEIGGKPDYPHIQIVY